MKTAIFSDVHGNLPALEKFISSTFDQVDQYLCLGDVVNYGPWSDECVSIVSTLPGIIFIEGNHEEMFLNPHLVTEEIPLVQDFFKETFSHFTKFDEIRNLSQEIYFEEFLCSHTIGQQRIYPDSDISLDCNRIIGHSHHQYILESNGFKLVNPGSVGQNRKWINVIDYALYDHDGKKFELFSLNYDHKPLIREMKRLKYPKACTDYYEGKDLRD